MSRGRKDQPSDVDRRLEFESFLAEVTAGFVSAEPEAVDRTIDTVLHRLCGFLDLDAAMVWQWCERDPGALCLSHVDRPSSSRQTARDADVEGAFPWTVDQLAAGRIVRLARLDDAPPEARTDVETWRRLDLRSVLAFPLTSGGGAIIGVASFHGAPEGPEWTDEIVQRLRLVAQVVANSLDRKQSEAALRASEARLQLAAESADIGMWELDVDRGVFWANRRARDLFGFDPRAEITVDLVLESVHPEHRERVASVIDDAVDRGETIDIEYRLLLSDGADRWVHSCGRRETGPAGRSARLLGATVDVSERRRAEELQRDHLRFETLLADLSARVVMKSGEELDREIDSALRRIGEFFDCDRCGLITTDDGRTLRLSHAWFGEGIRQVSLERELAELFPWTSEQLLAEGRAVGFTSLDELPPEAKVDRELWLSEGVKSSLAVPLVNDRGVRHLLIIQSLGSECVWPPELIPRLALLCAVFENALDRRRADDELRRSYAEVEGLRRQLELENVYLLRERRLEHSGDRFVGEHPSVAELLGLVEQVAPTQTTVLIQGETGTGKELIAQRIHELSPRRDRTMVKVNCAALPSTLVESELFGREKGAYTGAVSREAGRFEIADGSTLFLDEIAELPFELQAKLLRVLEEGRFERVGSSKTLRSDVRVIAATNRDLQSEVEAGRFRRDLFFRLSVFPILIPPLRDRRTDIPLLVWSIVGDLKATINRTVERVPQEDMNRLQRYGWPGNVRELRNVVERAMILNPGPVLRLEVPVSPGTIDQPDLSLDEVQRRQIAMALEASRGRISGPGGAADRLKVKPTTLRSKMERLGMDPRRNPPGRPPSQ